MGAPIYDQLAAERLVDVPEPVVRPRPGGLTYSRLVPYRAQAALLDVEGHVRAHLSSVAEHDDDPDTRGRDVEITYHRRPDGVLVVGFLPGGHAAAPYLRLGYDGLTRVDEQLRAEVLGG